jgi:hypothetical protein
LAFIDGLDLSDDDTFRGHDCLRGGSFPHPLFLNRRSREGGLAHAAEVLYDLADSMKRRALKPLIAEWASLGAGFGGEPARTGGTPDLERLLLETARRAPAMARLFVMAATCLHEYGDLVAKHRLKRLITEEREEEHRATLGLLLDIAQRGTHPPEFETVIRGMRGRRKGAARPLFDIERETAALAARAERRASAVSRAWGLWCEEIEFRKDALRPAAWMMARHPGLVMRADFRGDLRASIVASLRHDEGAGRNEVALAMRAGGSRAQVRNAPRNLEMTGRVRAGKAEGANRREVELAQG